MATDILGSRSATFGGAFAAESALMKFPSIRGAAGQAQPAEVPLLLQSAQFSYAQGITRLYDLTTSNIYYVAGRAAGQGQLSQILGPAKLSQAFLRTYGSVCNAADHDLHFEMLAGCSVNADTTSVGQVGFSPDSSWLESHGFTAKYVVLTSIGLQMGAQSMVIQQNIGMEISSLEYFDSADAFTAADVSPLLLGV